MWRDLWTYRRRAVLAGAGLLTAVVAIAVSLALMTGGSGGRPAARATPSPDTPTADRPSPGLTGYDRGPWNAAPSEQAAASAAFPAIPAEVRRDPDAFAEAFGTELLTRDYRRATRTQLLAWAQGSSAPLTIVQVPLSGADRAKALITSLVTPGWDTGEIGTPVISAGQWLAWRSRQAYTTVSDVDVTTAGGFPPAGTTFTEPTTDRHYTATVALHSVVSGKPVVQRSRVSFEVVMTDHLGQFGAAELQHWVTTPSGGGS